MQKFWKCECGESHRSSEEACKDCEQTKDQGEEITDDTEERVAVLADFLDCRFTDLAAAYRRDNSFELGDKEYLVLTDEEADEAAKEYILDSVWAFNAEFLYHEMGLPREAIEMLKMFQEAKSEGANETFRAMLKDKDVFVRHAISADGREHLLSSYDGNEDEHEGYYIYRTS